MDHSHMALEPEDRQPGLGDALTGYYPFNRFAASLFVREACLLAAWPTFASSR